MMKKITLTVLMGLMSASVGAAPEPAQKPTEAEQYLLNQGVNISATFPSSTGMKAILADMGGQKRLFYVMPDGKQLISGNVYDAKGRNLTEYDLSRVAIPVSDNVQLTEQQLKDVFSRAEHAAAKLHEGTAGPTVFAIFDPYCKVCHAFYNKSRQAVAAGKLQIEWLPVALLDKSSKGLIASIYAAEDKTDAMRKMANYMLPVHNVSKELDVAIAKNILLMRDTQSRRVPTFIVKSETGIHVLRGLGDAQAGSLGNSEIAEILQ